MIYTARLGEEIRDENCDSFPNRIKECKFGKVNQFFAGLWRSKLHLN